MIIILFWHRIAFCARPVAGSVCERDALTIAIWLLFIPLAMGNSDSKLNFRKAVIELTSKTQVRYSHSAQPNLNLVKLKLKVEVKLIQNVIVIQY